MYPLTRYSWITDQAMARKNGLQRKDARGLTLQSTKGCRTVGTLDYKDLPMTVCVTFLSSTTMSYSPRGSTANCLHMISPSSLASPWTTWNKLSDLHRSEVFTRIQIFL